MNLRAPLAVVAACLLSACGSESFSLQITEGVGSAPQEHRLVGDTLRLVATEWSEGFGKTLEPSAPNSTTAPNLYTWRSDNPAVVEMIGPGVFVARRQGATYVNAHTEHAGGSVNITVCDAASVLRFSPREFVVNVGEMVTLIPTVGPVGGTPCFTASLVPLDKVVPAGAPPEPPLATLFNGNNYRGAISGSALHSGRVVVGKRTLRDTILVTVR